MAAIAGNGQQQNHIFDSVSGTLINFCFSFFLYGLNWSAAAQVPASCVLVFAYLVLSLVYGLKAKAYGKCKPSKFACNVVLF